jgi:ribokinase
MDPAYVDGVLREMDLGDIVLLQNETNEVQYIISAAHLAGMKVIFNPSPVSDELSSYPLKDVDVFILNEIEGRVLAGKDDPNDILDVLVSRFPDSSFFLTLGKDGSIFRSGNESIRQVAYPTQRVDTTAAGDTYTGYLLASLAEGRKFGEAMQIASMAAAIAVSRKGASTSIPYRWEVLKNLEHIGSAKLEDRK